MLAWLSYGGIILLVCIFCKKKRGHCRYIFNTPPARILQSDGHNGAVYFKEII